MTNEHLEALAREIGVELRLDPEMNFSGSALRTAGDPDTGQIMMWHVEAPGAVDPDCYLATLHELGHAAYFAEHGMRIELDNIGQSEDDPRYRSPHPSPYELEQEAFAHRWSVAHAENGVQTPTPSMFVSLSSYLRAANPNDLRDPRALEFMLLIDEFGVTVDHFSEWLAKEGRCPGCGQIHN